MTEENAGGPTDRDPMRASAIFHLDDVVPPECRASLISRVLREFPNLPEPSRQSLRAAVNDEVMPTSGGFRRGQAGRALDGMPTILQEPMESGIRSSDKLACAVLKCWADSHPLLKEEMEKFLAEKEIPSAGLDRAARRFTGTWPIELLKGEQEGFCRDHSGYTPADVALMLCYLSGNVPVRPDPESAAFGAGKVLSDVLTYLREVPPSSPVWKDVIPNFAASVSRIAEDKAAQLRWAEDFDAKLKALTSDFGHLLAFFEQKDTDEWAAARVSPHVDSTTALGLVDGLRVLLAEYAAVHEMAGGITEERERSQQRTALQASILESLSGMADLMTDEHAGMSGSLPVGESTDGPVIPEIPLALPNSGSMSIEAPAPQAPPDREHQPNSFLQEAQRATPGGVAAVFEQSGISAEDYEALQQEVGSLREVTTALRSENEDLRAEVEVVKAERHGAEEMAESWRLAYRTAINGPVDEPQVPEPDVESVNDAVAKARNRFKQELVFAPNSESNIDDNPFVDPGKVWDALRWLANTYYASKMGRLRVTDFDQSIKEACGWWYKGDQGETTVSKFEKSYTTRVDGKRYTLVEHIGKGTTFDARYTIRIAFDWDKEKRQVVIGYIGRHQQTDAS